MGLSALLGSDTLSEGRQGDGLQTVPIEFLQPSALQPRQHFDENELKCPGGLDSIERSIATSRRSASGGCCA